MVPPAATAQSTPKASEAPAAVKIPRSLQEVDNGKILGYGAELAEGHPGFADEAYKQRRVDICRIASTHEMYRFTRGGGKRELKCILFAVRRLYT